MIIDFECPVCSEPLRVFHEDAGRPARCPLCDWRFVLPKRPGELTEPYTEDPATIFVTPLDACKIRDLRAGQKVNEYHKAMTQQTRERNWVYDYLMIKLVVLAVPIILFLVIGGCVLVLGNLGKTPESSRHAPATKSGE